MVKKILFLFLYLASSLIASVNINTADEKELMTLKGIGEAKAKAIIEYRKKNKGFQKPEDLMIVKGIGPKMYETIKNDVTVK